MRCLYLFLLISLSLATQAQTTTTAESQISYIVSCSFRIAPDSKLILDSLAPIVKAEDNGKLTAFFDALKLQWEAIVSDLPQTQKQKARQELEEMAAASPFKEVRAHVLFWLGNYDLFHSKGDETRALTQILKARTLLEEAQYERLPYAIEYYAALAEVYGYFGDYQNCIHYIEKAAAQPPSPYIGRQTLFNNLGTYYSRLGDYSKARQAYINAQAAAVALKQPGFVMLVEANLANLLRMQGQYRQALPTLYRHAVENEARIPEDAALTRLYVADCLLHLDSVNKAAAFLVRPSFIIPHWTQPAYDLTWYEVQSLYQQKSGNLVQALVYKDSLMAMKDSIRTARDNKKLAVLESSLQAERFAAERKALEADRFWRNVVIVVLSLASAAVVILLVLRHRAEKRNEAQKRLRAEELLAHADERLNQYLASIREKNELIDQIRLQLTEATSAPLPQPEKDQYVQNLQNSVLFTEPDWERFKTLFEQVFPGFFAGLLQRYPDLTPAEIRLLALEKLSLSDREKGSMLNISADSIKKARYRLRKKYPGLPDEAAQGV